MKRFIGGVVCLALAGCLPVDESRLPDGSGGTGGTGGNDGGADVEAIRDLVVTRSERIPTVATVTFRTDTPMRARAFLQPPDLDEVELGVVSQGGLTHTVVLLGAPEGLTSTFRIEVESDDDFASTEAIPFEAGLLDAGIPRPDVYDDGSGPALGQGYVVLSLRDAAPDKVPAILDAAGRLVWAMPDGDTVGHRVRLLPDGSGVAWQVVGSPEAPEGIQVVDFDGTPRWRVMGASLHQDFDMVDSETALMLGFELVDNPSPTGPERLLSDVVFEVRSDGAIQPRWRILDDVDYETRPDQAQGPEGSVEWAHVNYLDLQPDGLLYLTSWTMDAGFIVDLETGELDAALGYDGPDQPRPVVLDAPHSLWPSAEGLVVFEQRGGEGGSSSVKRFADLDGPAEELPLDGVRFNIPYLGNAQPLLDGTVMVTFSTAGELQRRSWSGDLLGALILPVGSTFGYAEWVARLGP